MNTTYQSGISCLANPLVINNKQHRQTGFTLTELLVAMLLGVLVLIAASSLFFSSYRTHRTTDAVSRIQEQQRLAFELMARDIRNADSFPCKEMKDPVYLVGHLHGGDHEILRYLLATNLVGNQDWGESIRVDPGGARTPFPSWNRHKERFDSLSIILDTSIRNPFDGNTFHYPVIEHHRPDGPIKVLNLDKREWSGIFVICNGEAAVLFGAETKNISGNTIQIKTSSIDSNGICGGGFTHTGYASGVMVGYCRGTHIMGGISYCFWGDTTVEPTEEDRLACDVIGRSQAYIYDAMDFYNPFNWLWRVENIDAEGKGELWGGGYGKVADGITRLQLRYRLQGSKKYVDAQTIVDNSPPFNFKRRKGGTGGTGRAVGTYSTGWNQVDSVHLKMTFQSPDNLGTDGKPIERTMETYIAIRNRMSDIHLL